MSSSKPNRALHPLAEALVATNLSQRELASAAGMYQPDVSQVIHGRRVLLPMTARRVIEALKRYGYELKLEQLVFPFFAEEGVAMDSE
jgi:plasmid maintenance system antidote protein VapI